MMSDQFSSLALHNLVGSKPFETHIPVRLLLSLHNVLSADHPLRLQVIEHIKEVGAKDPKAHWTRAIVQTESGDLVVDEGLYNIAVFRGKQETRMAAAEEAFGTLQGHLSLLHSFHVQEQATAVELQPGSATLVPIRELGPALQHMKQHAGALLQMAEEMKCGLANNVAGTIDHEN